MRVIRKFLSLPTDDKRFVLKAAFLLQVFRLALAFVPFRFVQRMATRSAKTWLKSHRDSVFFPDREKIRWAIAAVSRYLSPPKRCLVQSFAAMALLTEYGYPCTFRIGVTKDSGRNNFAAHAWVESGGRIITGGGIPANFTALPPVQVNQI